MGFVVYGFIPTDPPKWLPPLAFFGSILGFWIRNAVDRFHVLRGNDQTHRFVGVQGQRIQECKLVGARTGQQCAHQTVLVAEQEHQDSWAGPDGRGQRPKRHVGQTVLECYAKVTLWTNDVLTAARKIYQSFGFTLTREERHRSFDHDLVGQHWELDLS